jgi:hypothetical protein
MFPARKGARLTPRPETGRPQLHPSMFLFCSLQSICLLGDLRVCRCLVAAVRGRGLAAA